MDFGYNVGVIYVVILNWNGFEDTKECIFSLKGEDVKTVLVDNGSENKEGPKLKRLFPEIHLICNDKNVGFAGGCNIGILYCLKQDDCKFIMLLNNDIVVKEGFMKPLINYLNSHPKAVISPKILYYDNANRIQSMGGSLFLGGTRNIGKDKKSHQYKEISSPDYLSGACLIARKQVFSDVGLFDDAFFAYLEDLDWCIRAKQKGFKLLCIPDSLVYHKHSKSTKGSYVKSYLIIRNSIYFSRKHYSGLRKYLFISNSILIGFFANAVKYRNIASLRNYLKGVRDGLSGKTGDF